MRRSWRLLTVAGLATGALSFGAGAVTAGGGGHCAEPLAEGRGTTVEMLDACFTPAVLHVGVGDDVTFENLDPMAHNIAPAGWGWGRFEALQQGDTYSTRFDEEGVYPYACSLHPGMTGAVIVGRGFAGDAVDDAAITAGATVTPPRGAAASPWWIAAAGAAGVAAGTALSRGRRRRGTDRPEPPTLGR